MHCRRCDRLIIPAHVGQHHWVVAMVDVQQRRLLCFDSLHGEHPKLMEALQKWVLAEAEVRTEGTIHGLAYLLLASPAPDTSPPSALEASARGWGPLSTAAMLVRLSVLPDNI